MKKLLFTIVAMLAFTISISAYVQGFKLSGPYIYEEYSESYQTYPLSFGQEIIVDIINPSGASWEYSVGPEIQATKLSDTQLKIKYVKKGYPYGCGMIFNGDATSLWINFKE